MEPLRNFVTNKSKQDKGKGTVHIRTASFYNLLSTTLLNQFKLVYGPFWQSNMHSTLDFCPRPVRKVMNVPQKREVKSLLS
jgi:hypothetical protein